MTERRTEVFVTVLLLIMSVAYALQMLRYPGGAGVIPATVAGVMVAALLVQLALIMSKQSEPVDGSARPGSEATPTASSLSQADDARRAPQRHGGQDEVESDSYQSLLAVHGTDRRNLLVIVGYAIAYFVVAALAGFVIATGVLVPLLLLIEKERPFVILLGTAAGIGVSYLFVRLLLGLSLFEGYLF